MSNNIQIPSIAFGTYQLTEGLEAVSAVKLALKTGYKHIDTESVYHNEKSVEIAIAEFISEGGNKPFLTTKIPDSDYGYNSCFKAFKKSQEKLSCGIDLYLLHNPAAHLADSQRLIIDTWRAMEKLYEEGEIKTIGVSNFSVKHLEYLLAEAKIMPMVNQIEFHPQHQKKRL